MPSNRQRLFAVVTTAALFVGGAWIASGFGTQADAASANSEALSVTLHNARNDTGKLLVLVFDQKAAFDAVDYRKAVGYAERPASTKSQRISFPDLTQGHYAVIAIHDENEDYDLNMTDDGIPIEGYVVSGMNSLYDEPTFEHSLIEVGKTANLGFFYWE